jgi:2-dehydropantoate 2-reductase
LTLRICIYGAGAIGGYLAAKLANTGAKISLVARGAHLRAIRDNGLTVIEAGQPHTIAITATDAAADLGPQNYVFVTLKAHSIAGAIAPMQPLLGPDTAVVFALNGVPWWYFYGLKGRHENHRIQTVDPGGVIWQGIGAKRAIGCVVYPAAELREPGVILHRTGNRFSLGEPTGERSARVVRLAALLGEAGLKAPVRSRIRDEIWIKLWGNASFNPLSALTGATLSKIAGDPDTRLIISRIMSEIQTVGEAYGARFALGIEKRIAAAAAVGAHKTSMLQDLEKGRPMEIDALVGAVQELAGLAGVSTPNLDMILALIKQRARLAGCYSG